LGTSFSWASVTKLCFKNTKLLDNYLIQQVNKFFTKHKRHRENNLGQPTVLKEPIPLVYQFHLRIHSIEFFALVLLGKGEEENILSPLQIV
jgi:hypothetical protein